MTPILTTNIIELVLYGIRVFEDADLFNEWLKTKNIALGNIKPIELLGTIEGIKQVEEEIGRIEHGVF